MQSSTQDSLDLKTAVERAKNFIQDLYQNEGLMDLGLEEVEQEQPGGDWLVTIGFSRRGDPSGNLLAVALKQRRSLKVVRMSGMDGHVVSVKDRDRAA